MFESFLAHRNNQLRQQANIDKIMGILPCKNVIARYLLLQRKINRQQYWETHEANFINTYSKIKENLDTTDIEQTNVSNLLNTSNSCQLLLEHIQKLENKWLWA